MGVLREIRGDLGLNMNKGNSRGDSLGRRISLTTTGVVAGVFVIFFTIFIIYRVSVINTQLNTQLVRISKLAETRLVSIVWHLDVLAVSNFLKGIIADETVAYVGVVVDDVVLAKECNPDFLDREFAFFKNSADFIEQSVDITHLDTKIGIFQISLSRQKLFHELIFNLSFALALIAFGIVSIFFTSFFVTRRYVFNPLSKLEQSAKLIPAGKLITPVDTDLDLDRDDEIGVLSKAFNTKIKQLKSNIDILDSKVRVLKVELEQSKEATEKATQAQSEFLATMGHEIRTPLNSILEMAELLAETDLSRDQRHFVPALVASGELLLSIVNDILDFSKIESGRLQLESIPFSLSELVESVGGNLARRAQEKGLELLCRVAPEVHPFRVGDPVRLRQIFVNLLTNAIKFTQKGEVVLEVLNDPESSEQETLKFRVSFTGTRIAEEKLGMIFEGFSQVDTPSTRESGGTGLGLTVTRHLVELMDGRIWAESNAGVETAFVFVARIPGVKQPQSSATDLLPDLKGIRILVVDDNLMNRQILDEVFTPLGARVGEAESGGRALAELALAEKAREPYRLMLLDLKMPGMDGAHVLARMKTMELSTPPAVVMLTSSSYTGETTLYPDSSIVGYLVKPIKRSKLLEIILDILAKDLISREDRSANEKPGSIALPPLRILLAEDIETNKKLVELFLGDTPATIDAVENGKLAFEKYTLNKFDVVLMDIQMPIMDGYEATRAIRKWEQENGTDETPIIALTAHTFAQHQQKCYDAGCTGFIAKPIKKNGLLRVLAGIFPAPQTVPMAAVFGSKRIKANIKVDFQCFVPEFFEEITVALATIRRMMEDGDLDGVRTVGHGFKGAANNLEFFDLAELFFMLEKAAKNKKSELVEKQLAEVKCYLESVDIEYM